MRQYPRAENRMLPEQFSKALDDLNLTMREFCRLTGTNAKTSERWLLPTDHLDSKDIPSWVPVFLALLTLPGALQMARTVAQHFHMENDRG